MYHSGVTAIKTELATIVVEFTKLPSSKHVYVFQYLWNSGLVCESQLLGQIWRMTSRFLGQEGRTWRVNLRVVISPTGWIQNANHITKEHRMESVTETHTHIEARPNEKRTHRTLPKTRSRHAHANKEKPKTHSSFEFTREHFRDECCFDVVLLMQREAKPVFNCKAKWFMHGLCHACEDTLLL